MSQHPAIPHILVGFLPSPGYVTLNNFFQNRVQRGVCYTPRIIPKTLEIDVFQNHNEREFVSALVRRFGDRVHFVVPRPKESIDIDPTRFIFVASIRGISATNLSFNTGFGIAHKVFELPRIGGPGQFLPISQQLTHKESSARRKKIPPSIGS